MESALIKRIFPLIILSVFFVGCSSTKGPRPQALKVPMAININGDNSINFTDLNANFYRLNVKDILDDFLDIYPVLVEADENPQIIADISIENFHISPKDERTSRRYYSRNIQVGTDAKGQPVYQTVTATVDFRQIQISSNARLSGKLTIKGTPPKLFQSKKYFETYNWQNVSVENVQGDQRAVDPMIYSGTSFSGMEPTTNDILMALSNKEMLRDLSNELRKYYQKPRK